MFCLFHASSFQPIKILPVAAAAASSFIMCLPLSLCVCLCDNETMNYSIIKNGNNQNDIRSTDKMNLNVMLFYSFLWLLCRMNGRRRKNTAKTN